MALWATRVQQQHHIERKTVDDTDVYEWGERPDDHNFIAPMVVAQDPALSLRAKGLMFYLLALPKGSPMDSVTLAESVKEGRDAVRSTLTELEDGGYIVRRRRSLGAGKWMTVFRLLPYGRRLRTQADDGQLRTAQPPENSGPENPASDDQAADWTTQPPGNSGPKNPASSLEERGVGYVESGAAATTVLLNNELQNHVESARDGALDSSRPQQQDDVTQGDVTGQSHIPWTLTHLLEEWFGVKQPEQQQAWMQAWTTAVTTNGEGEYDVETDLTAYLTRCREEKREAKPSRWLRFLIEDRLKFIRAQQHHADVLDQRDNADGGEQWALRSLRQTPNWNITEGNQQ